MKVLITCNLPQEVRACIEKEHHVQINDKDRPMRAAGQGTPSEDERQLWSRL